MSRSYKKTPGFCDRSPFNKKQANKKVRKTKIVPNGKAYKKLYESYNICDFKCLYFSDLQILNSITVEYWYTRWKYDAHKEYEQDRNWIRKAYMK